MSEPSTGGSAATEAPQWPPVVAVVGPTASGKSDLAVRVALLAGAEIVNADAFQVYRGMDIGTAKPTPEQRAAVPHHLLDIADVTEEMSSADYQRLGRQVLADLAVRGVPAVVVGGSGLYVRALLDDLRFPGSDPAIRGRWEAALSRLGAPGLHRVLAERDPAAAQHILPSNGRRIVRALEVGELTGAPFPATLPADGPALVPHDSVGLAVQRDLLDERIAARVHRMYADGLVEEVADLMGRGLQRGRTASRALGYPQAMDVIEGRMDRPAAIEATVQATRRFARRQQRWFARDRRVQWVDALADPVSTASSIAARLAAASRTLAS